VKRTLTPEAKEHAEQRFELLLRAHRARVHEGVLRETMLEVERQRRRRQELNERLQRQNEELERLER